MTAIMQHLATTSSALPRDASALKASISALQSCISALDSSISGLEKASSPWECVAIVSAFAVVFGVIGEVIVLGSEYKEELHEWRRGIVWPPAHPPTWRFWVAVIGTTIVFAGVLGEAWSSMKLSAINSQLRSQTSLLRAKSDQLLSLITQEAGTAENSANEANAALEIAKKRLGEVESEANRLTGRLGIIKRNVDFQAPRREILLAAAPKIVSALKPYRGQKVGLYMCDSVQHIPEAADTWGIIAQMLANEKPRAPDVIAGANWKEVPSNLNILHGYCGGTGIQVFVSKRAHAKTLKAAEALRDSLFGTLPHSTYNQFLVQDPNLINLLLLRKFAVKGDAYVDAAMDPDLVTLVIGEHPAQ